MEQSLGYADGLPKTGWTTLPPDHLCQKPSLILEVTMRFACTVLFILLASGAIHPGVLWASGAVRPDVELEVGNHETGLSGYAGTKVKKVGLASDVHAVHEIKIGEWEDHPCYLRANKSDINHKTAQTYEDCNQLYN